MRQVRSNNKMMNKQSSLLTVAPLLVLLLLWVLTAPACVPPYRVDVHYSLIDSFINSFIPGGSSSTIPADHSQVNSIETTTRMGLSTSVLLTWSPFVQVLTMVITGVLSLAVIRTASIAIDLGGTQATMMNHSLACRLLAWCSSFGWGRWMDDDHFTKKILLFVVGVETQVPPLPALRRLTNEVEGWSVISNQSSIVIIVIIIVASESWKEGRGERRKLRWWMEWWKARYCWFVLLIIPYLRYTYRSLHGLLFSTF